MSHGRPQENNTSFSGTNYSSRGWRAPQRSTQYTSDLIDDMDDFSIPGCDNSSSRRRLSQPLEPASGDTYSSYQKEGLPAVKQLNQSVKKLSIETDLAREEKDIEVFTRADDSFPSFASTGKVGKREIVGAKTAAKTKFPAPLQPNPPLPSILSLSKNNKQPQDEGNLSSSKSCSTPGTPAKEGNLFWSGDKVTTTSFPSFLGQTIRTTNSEFSNEDAVLSPYTSSSEDSANIHLDSVSRENKFASFHDNGMFSPQSDTTTETRSRASSEDDGRSTSSLPSATENKVFFPYTDTFVSSMSSPSKHSVAVPFVEAEWKIWQDLRKENCLTRNELAAIVDRAVDRRLSSNSSMTCTKLVELCNEGKAYVMDILFILSSRPIVNDAAMTLKCLYLIHRLCLEGPIDSLWQGRHDSLPLLDTISKNWTKPRNESLAVHPARSICSRYSSFILDKYRFHLEFPEFETNYSLDRFFRRLEIEQVDPVQSAHNNQRYLKVISYSTASRLLFLLEGIIRVLKNLVERRHLGPAVEVCVLPCIEEAKGLHVICVYLFSKLLKMPTELVQFSRSEQEDMITNFEELHKILRSTFQVCRSFESMNVDIPELSPILTLPNSSCQRPESRDTLHIKCHFHSFAALHKAFEPEHAPEVLSE
ncbi:hypothetical protein GpartN1_g6813.t1 [Galdieria partita]|uniref:AP180 N-terminal homology (ANTH) domain-containing protein n=1 Tax=Galdieria partita TaxID=83374 RepID=A0A9C7UTV4_9RHOD|nr:hypothetical protein GpartN1_g6813.t1 [Galdieria partita]